MLNQNSAELVMLLKQANKLTILTTEVVFSISIVDFSQSYPIKIVVIHIQGHIQGEGAGGVLPLPLR